MCRLSMVALRATARHVLRGLAIFSPPYIHQHNAREATRRAHHDDARDGRRRGRAAARGAEPLELAAVGAVDRVAAVGDLLDVERHRRRLAHRGGWSVLGRVATESRADQLADWSSTPSSSGPSRFDP